MKATEHLLAEKTTVKKTTAKKSADKKVVATASAKDTKTTAVRKSAQRGV